MVDTTYKNGDHGDGLWLLYPQSIKPQLSIFLSWISPNFIGYHGDSYEMVLLPISLDSGVLLSSPVSKMEPKRKRIRITKFSIWGCDFQKGQPTMKRSFATYIHACCSAVQRQHGEAFSSQPHDTNSITLSRHHVKWQWQAHYYSELLCSMHCKLALWRHWNLILYNVIEREVRSSLNIAVSLAPCPSRIQTKWYSQIQTQLSHRAKSLQAHAHEATEPNCTSPLVPGSSIQVLWNSTSNITNFAKCKSPGWIITKKPCDTSGKDQTSLSALSIGCTSKSFTR